MQMPILRSLFGQSNDQISQSDIIMLLTPHIVRTHELTAADLAPIFIGTQSNIGLSGPPPLIAPGDPPAVGTPPTGAGVAPGVPAPGVPRPPVAGEPGAQPVNRPRASRDVRRADANRSDTAGDSAAGDRCAAGNTADRAGHSAT